MNLGGGISPITSTLLKFKGATVPTGKYIGQSRNPLAKGYGYKLKQQLFKLKPAGFDNKGL